MVYTVVAHLPPWSAQPDASIIFQQSKPSWCLSNFILDRPDIIRQDDVYYAGYPRKNLFWTLSRQNQSNRIRIPKPSHSILQPNYRELYSVLPGRWCFEPCSARTSWQPRILLCPGCPSMRLAMEFVRDFKALLSSFANIATLYIYIYIQKYPLTPGDCRGSTLEKRGQARKQEARACKTSKKQGPVQEARKQDARSYQRQLESKRQDHARRARSRGQRKKPESQKAQCQRLPGTRGWSYSFLSVQKATLGTGSRWPRARSVLRYRGVSLWRGQGFGSLKAAIWS